ncbi:MAG: serine/threonine protein kinase [Kofleriaceae bacterium]|nr:serine/threonine protein kinase [Kofleriaceae bacterium]MCB9573248.1 serine/threonine protein kinase [Kofleriaceae bacterium]
MSTPAPRYVCPRCRTSYDEPLRFCQQCGANMQRASALELAARREGVSSEDLGAAGLAATLDSGRAGRAGSEAGRAGSEADRADPSDVHGWTAAADRRLSASVQTWLGRVVDGRYRVLEAIGRGGMGVVYKVEHVRMGKIAAMKVLHKDLADDPDVVRRFEREAAAVSRLDHPNTVQVFDFGAAQGALYLIMEYVRGQDLGAIVERDGPLPFARAAPLLVQIGGALAEAHALGIVHRDLKPENVLITRTTGGRDFAKVLDFGLAKLGAREQAPDVTDKTEIVGTPYFMSPEQIRGDEVDGRSDLYSLGALMYAVLTGRPPFTARSAVGVLTKHLTAEVVPPSQVAPELGLTPEIDEIVLRAMAKDPAARFVTATAMTTELEAVWRAQVGDGTPVSLPRPSRRLYTEDDEPLSELRLRRADLDDFERGLRRRRWVVLALALTALAGVAAAAAWWLLFRPRPPHTAEVEPNDDDAHATRIAAGADVTGYLGRRVSRSEPDRDFYRVDLPGGHSRPITVRVSGLPNLDITVVLRDGRGAVVAAADEAGRGGDETLRRWRLAGPALVEVTETLAPGQTYPTENVSDPYTLSVTVDDEDAGWESEPNGNAPDATPAPPGSAVRGWLDSRGDVDLLRWDGDAGPVTVDVAADPSLPLTWRGPDGAAHGPGQATLTLARGAIIRLERTDRELPHDRPLPGADAPWAVTLTPAK